MNKKGKSNKNKSKKEIKSRVTRNKKMDNNIKLAILFASIALILVSYLLFDIVITLILTLGIGLIIGISQLLKKINKQKKKRKILNIFLIIILTLGIIGMCCFGAFLVYIKIEAEPRYKANQLNTNEISKLYDKDGKLFAKLGAEKREKVKYDQLPQVLIDAIVATEDSRFFQHNGFDAPRFIKASIGQVMGNSDAGGASTLSMQVVKNVFTDKTIDEGLAGIIRKFEDIYLSIFKLEKDYTKQEIIEFYVNNHSLGGNIYGVEEAAQTYFGKSVGELNLSEASIIAGMFKAPNYYQPVKNPKNAAERRKTVLYLMRRHGYITKEEEELANSIPVESLTSTSQVTEVKYQGYVDTVVDEIKDKYGVNPYTTPLVVYTNLDPSKQDGVDKVMSGETYNWIDDIVQAGVAVLDVDTGKILAIGNGRNRSGARQTNYATGIYRQPGSTAKPIFDYGPGIEYNNWSTYQLFDDAPYSYSNGRSIKNWDGGYFGTITLRRALATSRNIPALKAFQQVKNDKIREFVTNLGITPEICNSGYEYNKDKDKCVNKNNPSDMKEPSAIHEAHAIGAFSPGTNPLEMSAAYAAFANGGYYNEPYSVSKIEYRSTGKVEEHKSNKKRVMSDATAFMITSVLQNVALNGGTPANIACKTGTTNYDEATMNNRGLPYDAIRDSWVVGYSTKTVMALWYGYDYIDPEHCLHNIPASVQKDKIFTALVNSGAIEADRGQWSPPSSVVSVGVAPGSNPAKLAAPGQDAIYEYFKKGYEPTEVDTSWYRLPAPGNFKVTFDETTNKVTLSWSSVSPGELGKSEYGAFGYNVYQGNTLLGWTDKLTYSFITTSPYTTYKVVATYKSYSGLKSNEATYTLKEQKEEETPTEPTTSPTPTTSPATP